MCKLRAVFLVLIGLVGTSHAEESIKNGPIPDFVRNSNGSKSLGETRHPISSGQLVFHGKNVFQALEDNQWDTVEQSIFQGMAIGQSSPQRQASLLADYYQTYFLISVLQEEEKIAIQFLRKRDIAESKEPRPDFLLKTEYDELKKLPHAEIKSLVKKILAQYPVRDLIPRKEELSDRPKINNNETSRDLIPPNHELPNSHEAPIKFNNSFKSVTSDNSQSIPLAVRDK